MSFEKISKLENQLFSLSRNYQNINYKLKNTILENNQLKMNNNFLKTEVENIKSKYECCVCMKEQKNVILEPCLHFSICEQCLSKLSECPVCRKKIDFFYKIY